MDSVLTSTFGDFEYLISDDCSGDVSWNMIQEYTDPRIRSWKYDRNLGEYANRNKVLQEAKGKFIIFVDGDDVLYKHTLRNLQEYIQEFPESVSIWGVWTHELSFCKFPVLLQPIETMQWIYAANLPISIMGFGETVFKTERLKKIGGFKEDLIAGDSYVKKRIALEGGVLLIPIGLMYWRKSEGQASSRLGQSYNGYKNNVMIDRIILQQPFFDDYEDHRKLFKSNTKVRDIKVLFGHTFLRGKVSVWYKLMRSMDFNYKDLLYLRKHADFSYKNILVKMNFNGKHRINAK